MSPRTAIILGVGPGLSASLARKFVGSHNIVLLSRSLPSSYPSLNLNLPSQSYLALTSDGSPETLKEAITQAQKKWPESVIDLGIFNTGGGFAPGSFLDQGVEVLKGNFEKNVVASWNFGQALIPLFLKNHDATSGEVGREEGNGGKGTLLFTGATMAMRGGAMFSGMAPTMSARRALSQSLAREFGPKGIHVAHVVVDGRIGTEEGEDGFLNPREMAETYYALYKQHKSVWTQEIDIRPYNETF